MKPVLLLIPGMLNTAAIWSRITPLLEAEVEVRIANVQTQSTIPDMASDAWKLVADVPEDRPLVICGFSMGGYTAQEMLAHPKRAVSALGLLGTSARPETPEGAAQREKTIAAVGKDFARVVDGVLHFGTAAATHAQPDLMQAMRGIMLDVGPEAMIRQTRAIMARADQRPTAQQLKLPVLVMCGTEDKITPPELSTELAGLIPGARLEWIEGAGHMSPMEQPERVAALLKTLL